MNPDVSLTSKGVKLPFDKTGKTPLDYVSCASDLFKPLSEGSSYYRRILLLHTPEGTTTYKSNMEKRLGPTLKQSYVNRITAMLNFGMILLGNSYITDRFLIVEIRPGEDIRMWKN